MIIMTKRQANCRAFVNVGVVEVAECVNPKYRKFLGSLVLGPQSPVPLFIPTLKNMVIVCKAHMHAESIGGLGHAPLKALKN